jgi:predicted transcriptional regulator
MTVTEIAARLGGTVLGGVGGAGQPVGGGYASDLLSDVMGHALEGDVWVTLQKHVNIVAVAQLKSLAAIVIVNGRQPEGDTLARAAEHGVPIVTTDHSAFDVAGVLYALGIRGSRAS